MRMDDGWTRGRVHRDPKSYFTLDDSVPGNPQEIEDAPSQSDEAHHIGDVIHIDVKEFIIREVTSEPDEADKSEVVVSRN